jgi:hypothetical protein
VKVRTNGKNNIRFRRILFLPKPERFPDYSFEAISLHRTTNISMNTDPQSIRPRCGWPTDQGKTVTMQTLSTAIDLFKFPPFS